MQHEAVESFEIERKFDVDAHLALPPAAAFAKLGLQLNPAERYELHASYFDTASGELAAKRMALRQRSGGKDAGWHLKLKGERGARELLWPPAKTMPKQLCTMLEEHFGAGILERLGAVATLRTERVLTVVCDIAGGSVVELADDRVQARNELNGKSLSWREWEAELMPEAEETLLDTLEAILVSAGARRVHGTSKIQRIMQVEE